MKKNMKQKLLSSVLSAVMVFTPLAATLPFIACGGNDDKKEETDCRGYFDFKVNFNGNPNTIIDVVDDCTGYQDFESIKGKLKQGVQDAIGNMAGPDKPKFDTVFGRGLTIIVKSGNDYVDAVDGSTISVGIDYLLNLDAAGTWGEIYSAIIDAAGKPVAIRSSEMLHYIAIKKAVKKEMDRLAKMQASQDELQYN